jgi:hypothetical protein
MNLREAGPWFSVCAGIAAAAALVRWPYSLLAELFLASATLLAAGFFVVWIIGLFYNNISYIYQVLTLLGAGTLLGAYLITATAYFTGYIGYNYPASQQRIYEQGEQIKSLTQNVRDLQDQLTSSTTQLADAKKAMADSQSVSDPRYNLETFLKLQFDNAGAAQAVEARNITWNQISIPEAKETGTVTVTPKQIGEQATSSIDCASLANIGDPRCGGGVLLRGTQSCPQMECPAAPKYETSTALVIMLEFLYPIRASGVKIESHGASLPAYKTLSLTNTSSIIMFDSKLRNVVLDILVEQKQAG